MFEVRIEQSKRETKPIISIEELSTRKKRYIHSRYNPEEEGRKWAETVYEQEAEIYIIFGMGLGYHIQELGRKAGKNVILVGVEPNRKELTEEAVPFLAVNTQALANRFEKIYFSEKQELYKNLNNFFADFSSDRIKVASLNYYEQIFPQEYKLFIEVMNRVLTHRRSYFDTKEGFAVENIENILNNTVYMDKGIFPAALADRFKGTDAVLVSAGPSLEKNINLLRGRENEFIIITGGRTLKTLLDKGIRPHFVVTVDASYENFLLFKDVLDCGVPLVTAWFSNQEIIRHYQGPKIFMDTGEIPSLAEKLYGERVHGLYASGTVATMQLDFARWIGCRSAAFIGQDLANTGGKKHADIAAHGGENRDDAQNDIQVRGNTEEFVFTTPLFDVYRKSMEWLIFELREWIEVFNCTEGGVYIEGTRVLPLKDFLEQHTHPLRNFYDEIGAIIQINQRKGNSDRIHREFLTMQRNTRRGIKTSEEILNILRKYFEGEPLSRKEIENLSRLEKKMEKYRKEMFIAEQMSIKLFREIGNIRINERLPIGKQEEMEWKRKRALYSTVNGTYRAFAFVLGAAVENLEQHMNKKEDRD